ncbi:hypothetical protein BsIDN1_25140 [Bacillus safensis]|uniref:EamA domain-containing protein n=1 Tax=Bacillus safensis TaxID=561879 RepID=A0A5S9MBH1_BACIA|nr:hypothetical protein BsIDN1_25140 [Bacillus safensis]
MQILLFGLMGMLSVQYTYMASIQHGNAAVATLLQYTAPVMIIVYLVIRRQSTFTRRDLVTVVLALAGIFFLIDEWFYFNINRSICGSDLGNIIGCGALVLYVISN